MNLEGIIPLLGGIYSTLLGFGVVPASKDPKHNARWMQKWGPFMKFAGPAMILFGIVLLLGVLK